MISRLHPENPPLRGVDPSSVSVCDEVILTRQDLEDGREEEASALDQPEELVEEGDEGEEAEEDGEDHQRLNRLDPVCKDTQGKVESLTESLTKTHHFIFRSSQGTPTNLRCWPACSGSLR